MKKGQSPALIAEKDRLKSKMTLALEDMNRLPDIMLTYGRFKTLSKKKSSFTIFTFTNVFMFLCGVVPSLFYTYKGISWNFHGGEECGRKFQDFVIAMALLNLLMACFCIAFILFALLITKKWGKASLVAFVVIIRGI